MNTAATAYSRMLARAGLWNAAAGKPADASVEDRRHACCDLAVRAACVCLVRWVCPTHGDRCHGSHD